MFFGYASTKHTPNNTTPNFTWVITTEASRPKSALHLVSYRWNHHFTDTAGGLTIPATIDTTSSVEHSFHHRCRWNYYSSDDHYRLISGVIIPATPTLD